MKSDDVQMKDTKIVSEYIFLDSKNITLKNVDFQGKYSFQSEVEADIKGNVISIKNPKSGTIMVDSVDEIIYEDSIMEVKGKVVIREK